MDMSGGDMDMDMGMGPGMPSLFYVQHMYWAAVGAVIAAFTLANLYNRFLCHHRLRSPTANPSRPRSPFAVTIASLTALLRELSNSSLTIRKYSTPTLGRLFLASANLIAVLVLSLYKFDLGNFASFEDIGYRTGFVAVCQLPLIFLLSGKRNIVALVIGSSYERINWLHRWASRCLFVTVTLHMAYWFADWAPYDFIGVKIQTDTITRRGVIAYAILLWIMISSMTPIRGWRYEVFVFQHIVSMLALTVMIYLHVPPQVQIYVWISIGLFVFDRLLRAAWNIYNNLVTKKLGHKAYLESITSDIVKITVPNTALSWTPGQHVLLSCHSLAPLQSHPFTIASIPSDGKLEFFVGIRTGATSKFRRHALSGGLATSRQGVETTVAIDGPYGCIRPLQQFDSIVMFAGSTGATFVMPLMRDIVHRCTTQSRVVTRRIKLVWVVKSGGHLTCFAKQLTAALEDVKTIDRDFEVDMSVYITCDDDFTQAQQGIVESMPASEQESSCTQLMETKEMVTVHEKQTCGQNGTCCCTADVDETDAAALERAVCTCNCTTTRTAESDSSASSTLVESKTRRQPLLHPAIRVLSGRPVPIKILRSTLEEARGESAVLVCGPRGLAENVRSSVVVLSDERAVHKGTGAQGIWLHTEAFGY